MQLLLSTVVGVIIKKSMFADFLIINILNISQNSKNINIINTSKNKGKQIKKELNFQLFFVAENSRVNSNIV